MKRQRQPFPFDDGQTERTDTIPADLRFGRGIRQADLFVFKKLGMVQAVDGKVAKVVMEASETIKQSKEGVSSSLFINSRMCSTGRAIMAVTSCMAADAYGCSGIRLSFILYGYARKSTSRQRIRSFFFGESSVYYMGITQREGVER